MKNLHIFLWLVTITVVYLAGPCPTSAADSNAALPSIIQSGLDSWAKGGGFDGAVYLWQKGGLLEGDRRAAELSSRLRRLNQPLGTYLNYELLKSDAVGKSCQVLYLALKFQRGSVFARFVLYRTDKDWVVQDLDMSTRPEAIMPWMSFAGDRAAEY